MSLILTDKYTAKKGMIYLFYTNRILRLLPLYFFYLIVSICIPFICLKLHIFYHKENALYYFMDYFKSLDITTLAYLVISNIFLVGHELSFFLGINFHNGSLFMTADWMRTSGPFVWQFFFIPQSWTLGLELMFYLTIPFLIRRLNLMVILILLSTVLRIYIYHAGYAGYNVGLWQYGFFPTELAMFLLGTLSYRLYLLLNDKNLLNNINSIVVSSVIFILTFCYPWLPQYNSLPYFFNNAQLILYPAVILGLPFLFHISKRSKIDNSIGEYSYPIYLCHAIIASFFSHLFDLEKSNLDIILIIFLSIFLSFIGITFIQKRVDNYRRNRLRSFQNNENIVTVATDVT
jgi:peptidoglycan/LPS O-acetylase OafA/YrhL